MEKNKCIQKLIVEENKEKISSNKNMIWTINQWIRSLRFIDHSKKLVGLKFDGQKKKNIVFVSLKFVYEVASRIQRYNFGVKVTAAPDTHTLASSLDSNSKQDWLIMHEEKPMLERLLNHPA
jgi:hypothetical protein